MKNKLLKILSVAAIGFSTMISTTNAMNLDNSNELSDNVHLDQEKIIGVSVSPERLEVLNNLNLNKVDVLLGYNSKTIATTYDYDDEGNVIEVREKEITPKEELLIDNNPNVHILSDGRLHDINKEIVSRTIHATSHETTYKIVSIFYYTQDGQYVIQLDNAWKKNPSKHSFDILAVRWENSKSTSNYSLDGYQIASNNAITNYNESSSLDHMVKYSYGAGLSQNLYDNVQPFVNRLFVRSSTSFGNTVYGTYQHATTNVSLATSKSYTISSSGLGGVINHTYSSYYDGMEGVFTYPV